MAPSDPAWREVHGLIEAEKYDAALARLSTIRKQALANRNDAEAGAALIWAADLRTQTENPFAAADYLRNEAWPQAVLPRMLVLLYYERMFDGYHLQSERPTDEASSQAQNLPKRLEDFSRRQMLNERLRIWAELWRLREALSRLPADTPLGLFEGYLLTNDYPSHIRGTLRDTVSYLAADAFAKIAQQGEWYGFNGRPALLALLMGRQQAPRQGTATSFALDDPRRHPIATCNEIYLDLAHWHRAQGRKEAALEAEIIRLQRLRDAFHGQKAHDLVRRHTAAVLPSYRSMPWWSVGMAKLVEWTRNDGDATAAHALAKTCLAAFPGSPGSTRCKQLKEKIEQPEFQLSSMNMDGPRRRSISISHRNLPAIYFRAYSVDFVARLKAQPDDTDGLYDADEVKRILVQQSPTATWTTRFVGKGTADYDDHTTFVTPPLDRAGHYVIVASTTSDFGSERNKLAWTTLLRSDLVILSRVDGPDGMLVRVVSGRTGSPLQNVAVTVHYSNTTETLRSDQNGEARFVDGPHGYTRFIVAHYGDDVSISSRATLGTGKSQVEDSSLLFTDRPVYRPGQKLHFRVVAYRGTFGMGSYEVQRRKRVHIRLEDARGRAVGAMALTMNQFGSAAGTFALPTSAMLGHWSLAISPFEGGPEQRHRVVVEAYRRPTFEVSLPRHSPGPARLDHVVTATGQARYYLGLPVTRGTVTWRVYRDEIYPWWWPWDTNRAARHFGLNDGDDRDHEDDDDEGSSPSRQWRDDGERDREVIATGATRLLPDGSFRIEFVPARELDSNEPAARELSYRYTIEADVTDESGETRSSRQQIQVGPTSVKATLSSRVELFRDDTAGTVTVRRTDLNDAPRPGKGKYRFVELIAPKAVALPDELPGKLRSSAAKIAAVELVGRDSAQEVMDAESRPRWADLPSVDKMVAAWPEGKQVRAGELEHGPSGQAEIAVQGLPAGAYRLYYETVDDFGSKVQTWREILVMSSAGAWRPRLPLVLAAERLTALSGEKARIFATTGLDNQPMFFEVFKHEKRIQQKLLLPGSSPWIEIPVSDDDQGGFSVTLTAVRDHQLLQQRLTVYVPWASKKLSVSFSTFRDKLRPGSKETWQVQVNDAHGRAVPARFAEVLTYMYDRSLELFATTEPPKIASLYPVAAPAPQTQSYFGCNLEKTLSEHGYGESLDTKLPFGKDHFRLRRFFLHKWHGHGRASRTPLLPDEDHDSDDPGNEEPIYGYGTLGLAGQGRPTAADKEQDQATPDGPPPPGAQPALQPQGKPRLRRRFSETAFFLPHLVTDRRGRVTFSFEVPDSVTSWRAWAHAISKDMAGGAVSRTSESVRDLLVRPFTPRFLREGDRAEIAVMVSNAGTAAATGKIALDVVDPVTRKSLLGHFVTLPKGSRQGPLTKSFSVSPGQSTLVTFAVDAPSRLGSYGLLVKAMSGRDSDGELRPFTVLSAGTHLVQSRSARLGENTDSIELELPALAGAKADELSDSDRLTVSVDAQLFYVLLKALPYLVEFPYECAEQTLNRFLSTGIVAALFHTKVGAREILGLANRTAQKRAAKTDPSHEIGRAMLIEESPWAYKNPAHDTTAELALLVGTKLLTANRDRALAKLRTLQAANGAFSWFPGGSASPYITLYILSGFAKAAEFGVEPPSDLLEKGWEFLSGHVQGRCSAGGDAPDCDSRFLTFLNYVASTYGEPSWANTFFPSSERKRLLELSFRDWKNLSVELRGMLALTLLRMGRSGDAKLVFASVMAEAKTSSLGEIYWQPRPHPWRWDHEDIENRAFSLRTLLELDPKSDKIEGLVFGLLLNRTLDQWKSTRATSEAIYALAHYLNHENSNARRQEAVVTIGAGPGAKSARFVFSPRMYRGQAETHLVGRQISPSHASIAVSKKGKGLMFATATWHHFSKEVAQKSVGNGLDLTRTYYLRRHEGNFETLRPLALGEHDVLAVGDLVEVKLTVRVAETTEYVHLRDPRPAGLEPQAVTSGWRHGPVGHYEETRDSSTNLFFESLPAGEHTFSYGLRVSMAGTFRVGSAVIQSMYAPEVAGTSAGAVIAVKN